MIRTKNWNSLSEVFNALNEQCNYLILRNYEELGDENYYMSGHEDIDFLCDNQKQMRKCIGAKRSLLIRSKDHFFIKIKDIPVKVGIRYIGDGYYDKRWAEEMLKNKILHKNGFYVMNGEDYFYSLIYHALLQKKTLSDDYQLRLTAMAEPYKAVAKSESEWLLILQTFLEKHSYKVTAPLDAIVPLRKDLIRTLPESLYDSKIYTGGYKRILLLESYVVNRLAHKIADGNQRKKWVKK